MSKVMNASPQMRPMFASGSGVDHHLLDLEVVGALEVAAVLRRTHALVGDPHDPAHLPGPQIVLDPRTST